MSFEFQIAKRYLTQKKETGFITLIAYISVLGLTIGITALILTLGVLNGFERSIKEKVIEFQAHIRLETYSNEGFENYIGLFRSIEEYEDVSAYSPFLEKECLLRHGGQTDGVIVRGVLKDKIQSVLNLEPLIKYGEFDLDLNDDNFYGILVGIDLYERFDLNIGDLLVLSSPPLPGSAQSRGFGRPSIRQYELRGVYETGMSEFDNLFAFIDLAESQSYFKMEGKITGIDITLNDLEQSDNFASMITKDLGYPFYARSWRDLNAVLFDWLNVQRLPILIAFGMIILVGSINLVSTQILIIHEKQKDIGILKSMGARKDSITLVFSLIGLFISILSTVAGSILAIILGWIQNTYQVVSLNKEVYYISTLPIDLEVMSFVKICCLAVVLCLAAMVYPALRASKLLPSVSIRQL
ncbi:FtsX-like permease family protein [candidate division KSB1 bacterium]